MQPIVVRISRWRYLIPLVGSLAIVAVSMGALRFRPSWTAWILFVAFLTSVSLFAQLMLQSRVRLIVDIVGIFDPTWEIGTVRWAEVEKVFVRDDGGREIVCVLLTDSARRYSQQGPVAKKLSGAMLMAGYGDFSFNATRLGIRADDILEFAERGFAASR